MSIGRNAKTCVNHNHWSTDYKFDSTMNFTTIMLGHKKRQVRLQADVSYDPFQIFPDLQHVKDNNLFHIDEGDVFYDFIGDQVHEFFEVFLHYFLSVPLYFSRCQEFR